MRPIHAGYSRIARLQIVDLFSCRFTKVIDGSTYSEFADGMGYEMENPPSAIRTWPFT